MAGIKSSKLETERRIFTIQGWIVSQVPDYLILKYVEQQFKNKEGNSLSRVQSKSLIRRARELWCQDEKATIEQKRTMAIDGLKQDLRSMKDAYKGTPQGMTAINNIKKEIHKLEALYPARVTIIQGDKENPLVVTDGSFDKDKELRLQELLKKAESMKIL